MELFQWAKYIPIIESNYNLALIRANTVPAGLDPRTEMGSIVGWNLISFWLSCYGAQMASGEAELDFDL